MINTNISLFNKTIQNNSFHLYFVSDLCALPSNKNYLISNFCTATQSTKRKAKIQNTTTTTICL